MDTPTFADNPEIVRAFLAGQEPNPEAVAYYDGLVIECEGCGKLIELSKAETRAVGNRLLISFQGHYAHAPLS